VIFYALFSYAFVTYATVEEAKAVFDKEENIEVDGKVLFINYSKPREGKKKKKNKIDIVLTCYTLNDIFLGSL